MNFIRILCHDSYAQCLTFLKKPNPKQKDDDKTTEMTITIEHRDEEESEAFQAWPSELNSSPNKNRAVASKMDAPISKLITKPVLIGNLDEDKLVKKASLIKDDDNPLFDDIQPKLLMNQKLKIKNLKVDNNNKNKKDSGQKLKLDENLGASDGWLDDAEIKF